MNNIACAGNGTSGNRVQAVYAYDKSMTSGYNQAVGSIRIALAGADSLMGQSSRDAGQEMHFLFVQDNQCYIEVKSVGLTASALSDFAIMIQDLHDAGLNETNRMYVVFADTTNASACGIATMVRDDRDTPDNRNNSGPTYSRLDRNCWASQAAAHELMHNLGAVQLSAPHSTVGSHCTDEWDLMCYSDPPQYPVMQYLCPDRATFEQRIDCNFDDYFNPRPQPGSYLDTHWNTANSAFLQPGPGKCATSTQDCLGTLRLTASRSSVKSGKQLSLTASLASADADMSTVTVRVCQGSTCQWEAGETIATLSGDPATLEWKATGKGAVTFLARASTGQGFVTSHPVTVEVKKAKKSKKKH